ncbi:MAG: S46 family peptidase [Bacteroidales bacterium]|jgi:hypothetical protein|nr:S46 family peptidase [Bacteroidales bacterium]MDD2264028.1 S46 family peptidase [Bacteroidales bacterium]MDD2831262.1 S46 family peptidase [Bacteroidales bacterium]MDD3208625.1 S46 family peptidase [Bacteroidales bacterium]MDD3697188.1 S46 family peptidase [Bacteroidales bacterium]
MKRLLVLFIPFFLFPLTVRSDEGMWLVNMLEKNLIRQMQKAGMKTDPGFIFDNDRITLSDAVVSMDFGCTGSIISDKGLLITNHHCAYSDIHAFSTDQKNYLEDGFWARNAQEEKPVPGKSVYFLRKAFDVTNRVLELRDSLPLRRMYSLLEKEYQEKTGYECMCAPMWNGSSYYMYCYQKYSDVRLVGAPPVSVAAFGGETDNWEWPQHKGDFALYRIYTAPDGSPAPYHPDNIPLVPAARLTINAGGIREGSFVMAMGYPYRTNRYNSSYGLNEKQSVTYPVLVRATKAHLEIMNKWMESDPSIRLQYANTYFGLANVSELREGEVLSLIRHRFADSRRKEEVMLQRWIDSSPEAREKWGTLLRDMDHAYEVTQELSAAREWYRQTLISSQFLLMARRVAGLRAETRRSGIDTVDCTQEEFRGYYDRMMNFYNSYHPGLEREWFMRALRDFCANVPMKYWGEHLISLYDSFDGDTDKLSGYVFENSVFRTKESFQKYFMTPHRFNDIVNDPACLINNSFSIQQYNKEEKRLLGDLSIRDLDTQYGRALFAFRQTQNIPQYPDANMTMRVTYGTVGPLIPRDGVFYNWYSTTQGIWDKWNPSNYEFRVPEKLDGILKARDWGKWADRKTGKMHVNFLCDLDITGGNSGSPVLDNRGRLVGLAFDGNKESLAADSFFHPELNKCVTLDIRYALWIIDKFARAHYLLNEMEITFNP